MDSTALFVSFLVPTNLLHRLLNANFQDAVGGRLLATALVQETQILVDDQVTRRHKLVRFWDEALHMLVSVAERFELLV